MRAVLADSGPLYALADPSDQYHGRAKREHAELSGHARELLVCYPVVLESHVLIQRNLGLKLARRWLNELVAKGSLLNPTTGDYLAAAATVEHFGDQVITLFDATVAALSKNLDFPVWTFDAAFDIMGVAVWRPGS